MVQLTRRHSREASSTGQLISRHTTLGRWNRTRPTKILVHGFLDTVDSVWWEEMKNALLQAVSSILSMISHSCILILYILKEDCNVILTDWSPANYFPYTKAAANAQIVGVDIALLVNKTISSYGADPADFHIIAHSLGAAVAGYAGKRITRLGRITGSLFFLPSVFVHFACLYLHRSRSGQSIV